MERILYLECNSGISGDMTVGALLDLGADRERLVRALDSLKVGGYHLYFGRKSKCGIDAFDFDVHLEEHGAEDHDHHHHHDHGEEGHDHHHHDHAEEDHDHHHHDHAEEDHDHHHHDHEGGHSHKGNSDHCHRNLRDVTEIIDRMEEKESVLIMAKKMFAIVAEAEAKSHGIPVDEVHFHEVGAIDSIVDIVSTAVLMDDLHVDKVIVSPLAEGRGYVRCQHGVIPVPVPATSNIASAYGLSMKATDNEGEMVTPTGAAIAAAYGCNEGLPGEYRIQKIGVGAGNKDFKNANILRAMLIEKAEEREKQQPDSMWVLETNIDDCSGEALGFAMEQLMDAGAADVWYMPAFMKKNRPAYVLHVLCGKDQISIMEDIIFSCTTTIGIRRYAVERTVLERKKGTVETEYGEAQVKICFHKGRVSCYPEYESVKEICVKGNMSYHDAYHLVRETAQRKYS